MADFDTIYELEEEEEEEEEESEPVVRSQELPRPRDAPDPVACCAKLREYPELEEPPGLLPGHPVLRYDQRSKAELGPSFAFPPSSLRPLPVGLATSSAAGCSARSRSSAPGSFPGTARHLSTEY